MDAIRPEPERRDKAWHQEALGMHLLASRIVLPHQALQPTTSRGAQAVGKPPGLHGTRPTLDCEGLRPTVGRQPAPITHPFKVGVEHRRGDGRPSQVGARLVPRDPWGEQSTPE